MDYRYRTEINFCPENARIQLESEPWIKWRKQGKWATYLGVGADPHGSVFVAVGLLGGEARVEGAHSAQQPWLLHEGDQNHRLPVLLLSVQVLVQKRKLWPVLWNRNYLLRFRFRFWLLKSYDSGSGSNFWKVMVPVPVPTFEKITVPVPVPAPYLDHKK